MRMPPIIIIAFLAATIVAPAYAEEESGKPAEIIDIELPVLIAPMVVNGRLEGYAYLTISLTPSSAAHIFELRSKVPYLQDAFLREVNHGTIVKASDPKAVDTDALKARLMARMRAIVPPDWVSAFKFEKIVIASPKGET